MLDETVVVFTAKSIERILREGGTSAWRLDRNHARQCAFALCTRNLKADWVQGKEAHHSAFLIGKIRDVIPCAPTPENNEAAENRYLIQFSEFARLNIPNIWRGDRNPVKYSTLADLGIDPSTLKWEPMPEEVTMRDTNGRAVLDKTIGVQPLTMAEAKRGLALTFNVAPESIEITIRG
ncbi:MAG TPA: hypothetical protein VGK24_10300 [Candidatus Angelobacter sp.]|jgi:hypothetical protein